METIINGIKFYIETCLTCGIQWAVPKSWQEQRKDDHKSFKCPNGHEQYYPGESEKERLQREIKEAKIKAAKSYQLAQENSLKFGAEIRSKRAYKAHLTIMKKQIEKLKSGKK